MRKPRHDVPALESRPTKRPGFLRRLVAGGLQYGPMFAVEVMCFFGTLVAFGILTDDHLSPKRQLGLGLVLVTLAMGAAEARFRLYRIVWAVAGLHDALAVCLAVIEATCLITIANALIPVSWRPFHAVIPILALPAVASMVGGLRLLPRLISRAPSADNRLLMVVPDHSAYQTIKAVAQQANPLWTPVAIVTANRREVHHTVMGIPVVGHTDDLRHYMDLTRADGVAFVLDGQDPNDLHELFGVCLTAELPVFIIPPAEEWLHSPRMNRLRQLSADDLVGRKPHRIDVEHAGERIAGRTVLVTGAAGSIGSELCRLLATLGPRRLVLVDNNESGLFDIGEELRVSGTVDIREALISIVDHDPLFALFAEERPELVFHAAAYKHVPMLESHPDQAVLVNVIGTQNTLRCAAAAGSEYFILVSTDKAVARHSVMGCTKRLCELLVLSHRGPLNCWAVRFGNVVGSRGSVVPTFERQIKAGGPVTITHPDVSRYMMTISEAASLVITTLRLAKPGHLYMLDMGEPIKILHLAQALIRSRGLRPGSDIEIVFTGLRPGERLTEELLGPDEGVRPTEHPSILEVVSTADAQTTDLEWKINRLQELAREGRSADLIRVLKQSVILDRNRAETEEPTLGRPERVARPDRD